MKVEGYDEFMLASAFDHLNGDVKAAREFMVKNVKLRKFWLDNFFKNVEIRSCVLSICSKILINLDGSSLAKIL
jgi:hypothetical protein